MINIIENALMLEAYKSRHKVKTKLLNTMLIRHK